MEYIIKLDINICVCVNVDWIQLPENMSSVDL